MFNIFALVTSLRTENFAHAVAQQLRQLTLIAPSKRAGKRKDDQFPHVFGAMPDSRHPATLQMTEK
jgi:hypothetical protein